MTNPTAPSRAQQLRDLVDVLVDIVAENAGSMRSSEAILALATRTGLPLHEGHYVINSAVADDRVHSSLRHGTVTLTEWESSTREERALAHGLDLDALEALASQATPGPWEYQFGAPEQQEDGSWYEPNQSGVVVGSIVNDFYDADAKYIAGVSPDIILRLIAERREWERRAMESLTLAEKNNAMARSALSTLRG